jgi:mannosyl-oligosaccharide glucosidase
MLDAGIPALKQKFTRRFERVLSLPQGSTEDQVSFSKAITSNLLGGIGYFYGDQVVDQGLVHEWDAEDDDDPTHKHNGPRRTPPKELFSATPSRSFFPRGFYW